MNRICIQRTTFIDHPSQAASHGYRAFDDNGSTYDNRMTEADMSSMALDFLDKMLGHGADDTLRDMLAFADELESSIDIDDGTYDYVDYHDVLVKHRIVRGPAYAGSHDLAEVAGQAARALYDLSLDQRSKVADVLGFARIIWEGAKDTDLALIGAIQRIAKSNGEDLEDLAVILERMDDLAKRLRSVAASKDTEEAKDLSKACIAISHDAMRHRLEKRH